MKRDNDFVWLVLILLTIWYFTSGGGGILPPQSGERTVVLVRETSDATPEMARAIVSLRTGRHADYLKTKGHSLLILDDDSVDKDGNPTPALAAVRPHYATMTLPVLFVLRRPSNEILHKQSISPKPTADEVMAIVKANGG